MTTILNSYSFMDLLKDKKYIPETANATTLIIQNVEDVLNSISRLVKMSATDYDFMDLLNDKGYGHSDDNWLPVPCNDNDIIMKSAI